MTGILGRRPAVDPATEPITIADAKAQVRLDGSDEDEAVLHKVQAAREFIENVTHRQFVTASWDYYLEDFPSEDFIALPLSPLQSLTTFQYVDAAGTLTTVPSTAYELDTNSEPGLIRLAYDQDWPTCRGDHWNDVRIRFVAGYGAAGSQPAVVREAVKMFFAHIYENREPVLIGTISSDLPMHLQSFINQLRVTELV